jgi:hypothetical protein
MGNQLEYWVAVTDATSPAYGLGHTMLEALVDAKAKGYKQINAIEITKDSFEAVKRGNPYSWVIKK